MGEPNSNPASGIVCPVPRRGCLVRTHSTDCVAKRCVKWGLHENEIHEVEQWDRSPCPVTPKLTYRDLLELKQLELDKVPQSPFKTLSDLPVIGLPRVGVGLQPIFDRKPCEKAPTPNATPVPTPDRADSPQIGPKSLPSPAPTPPCPIQPNPTPPDDFPTSNTPSSDSRNPHTPEEEEPTSVPRVSVKETSNQISQALSITSALLVTPAPKKYSSPKKPTLQGFHFMPLLSTTDGCGSPISPTSTALPTPPPSTSSCDGESELDDDAQTTTEDDSVSQVSESARSDRDEDEPTLAWADGEIQVPQEPGHSSLPRINENGTDEICPSSYTLPQTTSSNLEPIISHHNPLTTTISPSIYNPTYANRVATSQWRLMGSYPPPRNQPIVTHHRPYIATCARGPHLMQRSMAPCRPGAGVGFGRSSRGRV